MAETPSFGASISTDFILGIGKTANKVVMLLDVDRVLSDSEIAAVSQVTNLAPDANKGG
jgi:purine-binding chemotaxis protein CheW